MSHTPGPWKVHNERSIVPDRTNPTDKDPVFILAECYRSSVEDNARLIAAAPDLFSDARDTVAWLRRHLERLTYIAESDQSGHPHGYSVVQIPDWEVRQKLEALEETLGKLTVGEAAGRTA